MKHYNILVVGGVAAGMSAASQARRIDENLSIGVFEKNEYVSYAACGIPYMIDNEIADRDKLIAIDKDRFINERNIQIFTNSEVTGIDFSKKTVSVNENGQTGNISYDKLVIATGARAFVPPIAGVESRNVFFLKNFNDGIRIQDFIKNSLPASGVLIGGGIIGLEMAESLRTLGIETIMIEKGDTIAAAFDTGIQERINKELVSQDVSIRTGADIKKIEEHNKRLRIIYDNIEVETDFIIVAVGIRPNTEFLKDSGLSMDGKGAIIVNEKSETNIPDVYSAGDCATVKHLITGENVYMPLGSTANKQGRVAGLQAAGISSEIFKGVVGTQFVKVFDLEVARTGLTEAEADKQGIAVEAADVEWKSRAGYCPRSRKIYVKIVINSETREVIGGQTSGKDGAALRANVIATAITSKMKLEDFAYLDLGYAPPFSPVWDSLHAAAQKLVKR